MHLETLSKKTFDLAFDLALSISICSIINNKREKLTRKESPSTTFEYLLNWNMWSNLVHQITVASTIHRI